MFQLIFRGECQPGTDVQAARNNARALFKASVEQVDRMFSGRPVVIRNRLEQDQAEKYRAVLARHGMVAYVERMVEKPAAPATAPSPEGAATAEAPPREAGPRPSQPSGRGPRIEPGDRLPVAGEKADEVLAGSSLGLDPPGTRLAQEKREPEPVFRHLDEWTLAPAGADLGVEREVPPPVVPDVSHLSLEAAPEPGESAKR